MAVRKPKIIFLTGAPKSQDLDWSDKSLSSELEPQIAELINLHYTPHERPLSSPATSWRQIPVEANANLKYSLLRISQSNRTFLEPVDRAGVSFLTVTSTGSTDNESTCLSSTTHDEETERLENSFNLQDSLESSLSSSTNSYTTVPTFPPSSEILSNQQPQSTSVSDSYGSFPSFNASAWATKLQRDTDPAVPRLPPAYASGIQLTTLSNLPSLAHVTALLPHTPPRIALLAAVTSLNKRKVQIRRRQRSQDKQGMSNDGMDLIVKDVIDVHVADDTLSVDGEPFLVTLWSPFNESLSAKNRKLPQKRTREHVSTSELNETEMDIKVGDITIFYPVSLNAFRGRIFAQSISQLVAARSGGIGTRVEVLARGGARIFGAGVGTKVVGMTDRLRAVKHWADRRLVLDPRPENEKSNNLHKEDHESESLPDDSMAWFRSQK